MAPLGAEITQLNEALWQRQMGLPTGLARRFRITPKLAWTLAADNADDEDNSVASSELSIVKDQP